MERDMKKEKDKKSSKYSFAFEEFIVTNEIDIKELPDYIQTMIRTISKQKQDAEKNCTKAHFRVVLNKLRKFADIVEDYLMNHFDERLANNEIEEEDDKLDKESLKLKNKIEAILGLAELNGRNYLLSSELKSLGIEVDYSKKEITVGELRLERELTTAKWYIGVNPNLKEVQS